MELSEFTNQAGQEVEFFTGIQTMNFQTAHQKLKKIANGRYFSLTYEIIEHQSGELVQECVVYLDPSIRHTAATWEAAFALLEPAPVVIDDFEEIDAYEPEDY